MRVRDLINHLEALAQEHADDIEVMAPDHDDEYGPVEEPRFRPEGSGRNRRRHVEIYGLWDG